MINILKYCEIWVPNIYIEIINPEMLILSQ